MITQPRGMKVDDALKILDNGEEMIDILKNIWNAEKIPYGSLTMNKIKGVLNKLER